MVGVANIWYKNIFPTEDEVKFSFLFTNQVSWHFRRSLET